jgi:hypothetical protein
MQPCWGGMTNVVPLPRATPGLLREIAQKLKNRNLPEEAKACEDAAAEIERLRAVADARSRAK